MVNKVLDAITTALYNVFGDDFKYYVEDIPQKLKTPCFTVETIEYNVRSYSKTRHFMTIPLVIQFFPKNEVNSKKYNYNIGSKIADAVEYINADGVLLRSENINYELNNDVLQVFVTYSFWTRDSVSSDYSDYMEDLKSVVKSK